MKTKDIAVDLEIHQEIAKERKDLDETDNTVLRRLLRLPESTVLDSQKPVAKRANILLSGGAWHGKNVELPAGTELFLDYPGASASGKIQNGEWLIEGETFRSPSRAASVIISRQRGREIAVNGWKCWNVKRPTDSKWIPLNSLRERVDKRSRRW